MTLLNTKYTFAKKVNTHESLSLSLSLCVSLFLALLLTVSTAQAQCPQEAQLVDCKKSLEGLVEIPIDGSLHSTLPEDTESGAASITVQIPVIVRDANGVPQTTGYIPTEVYVVFDETGFRYVGVSDNLIKVYGSGILQQLEEVTHDCDQVVSQPCGTSRILCWGRRALQYVTCKADNLRRLVAAAF